jgi:hypothetical protein
MDFVDARKLLIAMTFARRVLLPLDDLIMGCQPARKRAAVGFVDARKLLIAMTFARRVLLPLDNAAQHC